MQGRIDRPEEYQDIATKCVQEFRTQNKKQCLVILSKNDEVHDNIKTSAELESYYDIIWDNTQSHKFKKISQHSKAIEKFR